MMYVAVYVTDKQHNTQYRKLKDMSNVDPTKTGVNPSITHILKSGKSIVVTE